jgi:hypothetical protein
MVMGWIRNMAGFGRLGFNGRGNPLETGKGWEIYYSWMKKGWI